MIDWPSVSDLALREAPSPDWEDFDAAAVVWTEAGRHTRDAITEVLLDD